MWLYCFEIWTLTFSFGVSPLTCVWIWLLPPPLRWSLSPPTSRRLSPPSSSSSLPLLSLSSASLLQLVLNYIFQNRFVIKCTWFTKNWIINFFRVNSTVVLACYDDLPHPYKSTQVNFSNLQTKNVLKFHTKKPKKTPWSTFLYLVLTLGFQRGEFVVAARRPFLQGLFPVCEYCWLLFLLLKDGINDAYIHLYINTQVQFLTTWFMFLETCFQLCYDMQYI